MRFRPLALLLAGAAALVVSGAAAQVTMNGSPTPFADVGSAIVPVVSRGATVMTVKGTGAALFGFSLTQGSTAGFFAFLDAATAPAAGAAITPVECVAVPANGYVARRQDIGDRYLSGLQIVSTSSCTTYTAVTPVQMSAMVQ